MGRSSTGVEWRGGDDHLESKLAGVERGVGPPALPQLADHRAWRGRLHLRGLQPAAATGQSRSWWRSSTPRSTSSLTSFWRTSTLVSILATTPPSRHVADTAGRYEDSGAMGIPVQPFPSWM